MKFLVALFTTLLLSTSALAQSIIYTSIIRGENEVPPVQTTVAGAFLARDSDNRWFMSIKGAVEGDRIVAAHFHCGQVGVNGPLFYSFWFGPPSRRISPKGQFNDPSFIPYQPTATCPTVISNVAQLKEAINAGRVYINIHSQKYPNGVARGQVNQFVQLP